MTCKDCNYYRETIDGPYCYKGKIGPVSPIQEKDCWEPVTEKPQIATKVCKRCHRELPISEFGRHSKTKDGYQPVCKECRSKDMKGVPQRKGNNLDSAIPGTDAWLDAQFCDPQKKAKKKAEPVDDKPIPTALEQYSDDQLIAEIRKRGWNGRLTITKNYML